MSSPSDSPDAAHNHNDAVSNSNGEATQFKPQNQKDGNGTIISILPAALELDRINIQHTSKNSIHGVYITLDEWLQRRRDGATSEPTAQGQGEEEEDLQERLRVAIATTKALRDVRARNSTSESEGVQYYQLSLETIVLEISDSYCVATLLVDSNGNKDDENNIPSGTRANYAHMKQLGFILNAIFGGTSSSSMGMQAEQKTVEDEDRPSKKRGKSQQVQVGENLPLYLACLISSLIRTTKDCTSEDTLALGHYDCVEHVLGDLQMAAKMPQVYLKNNSWDDAKNNRLRIPHNLFYGRKSELSLVMHSFDTVLRFGQPIMVSVSGYAGTG